MLSALGLLAGKYRLARELGRGSFGAVYAARVEPEGHPVALKLLARFDEGRSVERFKREAQILARIPPHPNIVRVLDAGEHGGLPFVVMELVRGGSLAQALKEGRRPTVLQAARLIEKVALGLDHLHRASVVHRDVNANNVLIEEGGEPRLVDFGLALDKERMTRLTTTGELVGTPLAFAPEQLEGKQDVVGPGVDIYAASALLYELVTGKPPFADARSFGELADRIRNEVPERASEINPEVSEALALVIEQGLAKKAENRPASAGELARLLAEAVQKDVAREARDAVRPAPAAPTRPPRPARPVATEPAPPRRVGVYEVLSPVARTPNGAIFLARHAQLGREVSVLLAPPERAPDLSARPRVAHPSVAALYDSGLDAGFAFLGLEAVRGSLVTLGRASGPLEPRRALDVASQVARALEALRERGAAPATLHSWDVLLDAAGRAKILPENPAVAAARTLGGRTGSAPETLERAADARTDVWNAGKVLFHSIATAGADDGPLARAAQAIARRAGAPDPADRFPDAAAFARACEDALESVPAEPAPGQLPGRVPPSRRRALVALGVVLAAFVTVVLATTTLWRRHALALEEASRRALADELLAQARERSGSEGRGAEVRALLERCLALAPPDDARLLEAGETLLAVGDVPAAREPLIRAAHEGDARASGPTALEALVALDLTDALVQRGIALSGEPARRLAALLEIFDPRDAKGGGAHARASRRRALVLAARARATLDAGPPGNGASPDAKGAPEAGSIQALDASLTAAAREDPGPELLEALAEVKRLEDAPALAETLATAALAHRAARTSRDVRACAALAARLQARLELDKLEGASADVEALLRANPGHARGLALRAWLRARQGDSAGARADLAASDAASDGLARDGLARDVPALLAALRGRVALELGDPARALEDFEHAVLKAPRWGQPAIGRARALAASGDLDASLRAWEAARVLAPRDPRAWTGTGETLLARRRGGDLDQARDALERAVSLDPRDAHALVVRAAVEEAARELDRADSFLERACELAPSSTEALRERGRLRGRRGDALGARALLERAVALDPRDPESHAALALVLGSTGAGSTGAGSSEAGPRAPLDPELALAHWEAALQAKGTDARHRAVWFARRSTLRLARREVRVALEDCLRALDLARDEPRVLAAHARARAAQGDPRGALEDARAAVEQERRRASGSRPWNEPPLEPGETLADLEDLAEKLGSK